MSITVPADAFLFASAGIVSFVLLASAISKFLAPARARHAIENFGFQPALARAGQYGLPIAELLLAVSLTFTVGLIRAIAATVSVGMFLTFALLIWREVRRGRSFDCGCFGAFSKSPIDGFTVLRNVAFAALSATTLFNPLDSSTLAAALVGSNSAPTWGCISFVVGVFAIAGLIVNQRRHVRTLRVMLNAREGSQYLSDLAAQENDSIPGVEIVSRDGLVWNLKDFASNRAVLVFFIKSGCGGCAFVAERWADWKNQLGRSVTLVAVTSSRASDVQQLYPDLHEDSYYGALAARRALGIHIVPSAVLLGQNGLVATKVAEGKQQIAALVAGTADAVAAANSTPDR
ncbi:MauE/DoxX family redox-associated membrane protein [Paramicrobacterium sp. CJ85]|uniref:MauE/DoxX family redox-associated membrane protein n=1 Tax=Paramicrobacterium sp. CJ85 TaxID=3445355 RepID=UPI003F601AFF